MAYTFDENEFSDILENYEELLNKTKKYLSTIDKKIDDLITLGGDNPRQQIRGLDHNLANYMENAGNLISQASSIVDKILKVKKDIINYKLDAAIEDNGAENDFRETLELLKQQFNEMYKKGKSIPSIRDDSDDDFDKQLNERLENTTSK